MPMETMVTRLLLGVMVLAVSTGAQIAASEPLAQRGARFERNAAMDEGCGPHHHRGVGGACVLNPADGPYRPDPYWTPCDYSLGPQNPEGCAE
jgi:hypothetical protein